MVTVRWTGAAGLEITEGGRTVLIDPYHSRPGKFELLFGRPEPNTDVIDRYLTGLPDTVEAIIAGHTHIDHVLDIPQFGRRLECRVIGSRSLETLMTLHGRPGIVTVCKGGERIELPGNAVVTMIRSRHGLVLFGKAPYSGEINPKCRLPMRAFDYRIGDVYMPKLEVGGVVFMHAGSANFVESEIEGHRCDVLFMTVPGWKKLPEYCTRLPQILQPRVIVPFHYDDFSSPLRRDGTARPLPFQDIKGFFKRIAKAAPGCEIRTVRPFEPMVF
ncbi:MAG: MBL fold metallo-hydrolase [Deltaproteobacteria bacterium]|nr:MBL fold metallo-hydrolase [Deltaproteobacteria bacterium]